MGYHYCVSDIHGCCDEFLELLDKIEFGGSDKLFVLGDIIDRGNQVPQVVELIRSNDNMTLIKGNHEDMMLRHYGKNDPMWLNNGGVAYLVLSVSRGKYYSIKNPRLHNGV